MQVWQLNVHDQITNEVHTLAVVERHWRLVSVKLKVEDLTAIPAAGMTLSFEDFGVLSDDKRLPDYPTILNGSTLLLTYDISKVEPKQEESSDDEFYEENRGGSKARKKTLAPEVAKEKDMNANSVLSMGAMFNAGKVPGTCLSELQERSMITRRAKPKQEPAP
jgi:hypothetical protein